MKPVPTVPALPPPPARLPGFLLPSCPLPGSPLPLISSSHGDIDRRRARMRADGRRHRAGVRAGGIQDDRSRSRGAAAREGLARIDKFLADGVARGKVTPEARDATLGKLSGTTKFDDFAGCDLVIEAIVENVDEKRKAYAALDAVVGERGDLLLQHLVALHHRARRRRPGARIGLPGCTSSTPCR